MANPVQFFCFLVKEVRDVHLDVVASAGCEFNLERAGEAAAGVRPAVVSEIVDDWGLVYAGVIDLDLVVKTPRVVCHVKEPETEAHRELLELERVRVGFWRESLGKLCLHVLQGLQVEVAGARLSRVKGLPGERAHLVLAWIASWGY
jgi:hypothetical protein